MGAETSTANAKQKSMLPIPGAAIEVRSNPHYLPKSSLHNFDSISCLLDVRPLAPAEVASSDCGYFFSSLWLDLDWQSG